MYSAELTQLGHFWTFLVWFYLISSRIFKTVLLDSSLVNKQKQAKSLWIEKEKLKKLCRRDQRSLKNKDQAADSFSYENKNELFFNIPTIFWQAKLN